MRHVCCVVYGAVWCWCCCYAAAMRLLLPPRYRRSARVALASCALGDAQIIWFVACGVLCVATAAQ